jgi:hypothetical protein
MRSFALPMLAALFLPIAAHAATRDGDNDPVLGLSVDLRGGVTPVNFADTVGLRADTLDDFKDYIGWGQQ